MKKRKWSTSWSFYSFLVLLCCHGNFTDNIPNPVTQHAKDVNVPPAEPKNHNVVDKDKEGSSSRPEPSGAIGETGHPDPPDPDTNKLEVLKINIQQDVVSSVNPEAATFVEPAPLPTIEINDETQASSVNPKNVEIKDNIPLVLERLTTRQCSPLVSPLSTTDEDAAGPVPTTTTTTITTDEGSPLSLPIVDDPIGSPGEGATAEAKGESIEDKLVAKFASVLNRSNKGTDGFAVVGEDGDPGATVELVVAAAAAAASSGGSDLDAVGKPVDESSPASGESVAAAAGGDTGGSVPATEDMPSFNEWAKRRLEEQVKNGMSTPSVLSQQSKTIAKQKMRHKNYASMDCGAKVLTANGEAQSTSAVLSQNRDDYMLNPCTAKIWLVIELCESIQADRIELANYELFSSTPREFSVYSSDRYPSREWALLGKFEAKDERTVQSFNLEHSHFGKFIKVELVSHYGSEHFCLLSLVRVYGTSEYEALDTDDAEASGSGPINIEEEEDGFGTDSNQETQNLFGSAKDAVMNIVKKYTEALRSEKNGVAPSESVPNLQAGSDGGAVLPKQFDNCFCLQRIPEGSCEMPDESGGGVGTVPDGRRSARSKDFLLCHYPELLDILQHQGDLHMGKCASVCHILTEDENLVAEQSGALLGGEAGHRTHCPSCGFHLAVFGPVKFGALCLLHTLLLDEKRGTPPADRPRCHYGNVTVKPSLLTIDQVGDSLKGSAGEVQPEVPPPPPPSSIQSAMVLSTTSPFHTTRDVADATTTAAPFVSIQSVSRDASVTSESSTSDEQNPPILPTKTLADDKLAFSCPEDGDCLGGSASPPTSAIKKPEPVTGRWPSGEPPSRASAPTVDGSPRFLPDAVESPVPSGSAESSRVDLPVEDSPEQLLPPRPEAADTVAVPPPVIEGTFRVLGSPSTSAVFQSVTKFEGSAISVTVRSEQPVDSEAVVIKGNSDRPIDDRPPAAGGPTIETEVMPTAVLESLSSAVTPPLALPAVPDYVGSGAGSAVLVDSNGVGNVGNGERPSASVGSLPGGGAAPGQKESVFVRLSNRIKALELNMSLSSQYLEELSRRYRKQMEEMQRAFNKTIGALNESARLTHERDIHQQNVIELLQAQLENITLVVDGLQERQDGYVSQVIIQIVAQGLILVVLFLACSRPGQHVYRDRQRVTASSAPQLQQHLKSRNPSPTDLRGKQVAGAVKKRRNSDTSVVKHKRAANKSDQQQRLLMNDSRRPSTEALNVTGTYSDLLIIEPMLPMWMDRSPLHKELDPPKKRKHKNKGRPELCRSQSNRSLVHITNGVDNGQHKTHPKLSRKSSLQSNSSSSGSSSAGLLFGVMSSSSEGRGPPRVQDLPPSGQVTRRSTDAGHSAGAARRTVTSSASLPPPPSSSNGHHHYQGRHSLPWFPTNGTAVHASTSVINGCLPDLNPIGTTLSSFRPTQHPQPNLTMTNGIRKGSVQKVNG